MAIKMPYSYNDLRFAEYHVMTYVKKYPCLYYKDDPDYGEEEITTPIWNEISKTISANKVVETGLQCEQLWNKMWAQFENYRRRLKETAGQGKKIRFRWSTEMSEFDDLIKEQPQEKERRNQLLAMQKQVEEMQKKWKSADSARRKVKAQTKPGRNSKPTNRNQGQTVKSAANARQEWPVSQFKEFSAPKTHAQILRALEANKKKKLLSSQLASNNINNENAVSTTESQCTKKCKIEDSFATKSVEHTDMNGKKSQITNKIDTDRQSSIKQSQTKPQESNPMKTTSVASTSRSGGATANTNDIKLIKLPSQTNQPAVGGGQMTGKDSQVIHVGNHVVLAQSSASSSSAGTVLKKAEAGGSVPESKITSSSTGATSSQEHPCASDSTNCVRKGQKRPAEDISLEIENPFSIVHASDPGHLSIKKQDSEYDEAFGAFIAAKLRKIHALDKDVACDTEFELQKILYFAQKKAITASKSHESNSQVAILSPAKL